MKKVIALLLSILLVTSAFCLEAFATSKGTEGYRDGYWYNNLNIQSKQASVLFSWAGNGSFSTDLQVFYRDASGRLHGPLYQSGRHTSYGRTVSRTVSVSGTVESAEATFRIEQTVVSYLSGRP